MRKIYVVHHLEDEKDPLAFVDFDLCESYTDTLKNGTYHLKKITLMESFKDLKTTIASDMADIDDNKYMGDV